ncbi:MAG: hypothetical protein SCALA702_15100 [Melioribacteraceae bacterium]|nr:MAG: hypothetical protein SCALA702_15100 [Melioribacteraceae bacterium]
MSTANLKNVNTRSGAVPVEYLLQNLPFGMVIIDSEYNIQWVNSNIFRFAIVNHFTPEEILNNNIMQMKFFKNAAILKELVKLKNGENFEKKIPHDAGEPNTLFTRVKGRPLYAEGQYTGGLLILEQYSVEDKLVKEEYFRSENLNGLLQNLYDAYFITDSTGSIKYIPKWNKREEFNFPLPLTPKRIFDIFPGNSSLRMKRVYSELYQTKTRKSEDLVFPRFGGDIIFNADFTPFVDTNGEIVFVMVLVKDVTSERARERKREEEKHKLERYKIIASKILDALVITDTEGKIKIWNDSAESLFDFEMEPGFKQFVGDFIPSITKKQFKKIVAEIERTGKWESDLTILRDQTELVYVSVKMSIFFDDNEPHIAIVLSNITERARSERKLKESEQKFREIVTNTHEYICTFGIDGKITFVNPLFTRTLNLLDLELINTDFKDLIFNESDLEHFQIDTWGKNPPQGIELAIKKGEDEFILTSAEFSIVEDFKGDAKYYIAVLTDITKLKQDEKEILTLKALLEASQDGIAVQSKSEYVMVNETFAKLFGYDFNSEVIGKNPLDFVADENRLLVERYFENLRKTKSSHGRLEFLGKRKDGKEFFLELTGEAYQAGKTLYIVSIIRDITEQKRAERALRASEEKYRTVTDKINVSMWSAEVSQGRLRVQFYTPAVAQITGYSPDEFINDSRLWFKIMHPDDLDDIIDKFRKFLKSPSKEFEKFEYRILSKSGNIAWIENKINAIRSDEGVIVKLYGIIADISGNKRAEEELKRSAEDLKKLNETKDRFISIISHDLRTPFSSILGYTDLLLSGQRLTEEKRTEYIKFIRESSNNMLALVNSLLDWTRLQTDRIKFEPTRINAKEVIDKAIQMLSGNALKKDIELYSTLERDVFIHADENLLLQAFMNLISNAVKFTNSGGRVTIAARPLPLNKEFEFSVEDNGTGIKPEDLEKLFKVDTKFTLKGTGGEKGSGLGLSLVQEIIDKHGGNVKVESEYGKGSTFIFTIPISSAKILLVDDSNTDRILYHKLLANLLPNHKIIEAGNGEQAYTYIVNSAPALVITDHIMPQKTGMEMVKQLKDSPLKYKPPVLVLSSHLTPEIIENYKELGVEYIFAKPVNLKIFKAALDQSLKQSILS